MTRCDFLNIVYADSEGPDSATSVWSAYSIPEDRIISIRETNIRTYFRVIRIQTYHGDRYHSDSWVVGQAFVPSRWGRLVLPFHERIVSRYQQSRVKPNCSSFLLNPKATIYASYMQHSRVDCFQRNDAFQHSHAPTCGVNVACAISREKLRR